MDVDGALNELGMLSAVTDSRRDYQTEQQRRDGAASSCFHVVTVNPQFVVNIGAVRNNYSSKTNHQKTQGRDKVDASTIATPTKLEESTIERRNFKAPSRMHHRYFFRPYSKHKRTKQVCVVKDIQNRSLVGGFQIRLATPSEPTLTQAMASMNIERRTAAAAAAATNVLSGPSDVRPKKGLRSHAR